MTAIDYITTALDLNEDSSMLELTTARTRLNRIEDIVTSEVMVAGWNKASAHVHRLTQLQKERALSGQAVRIM